MTEQINLSIICPAYNEEAILVKNLETVNKYLHEVISKDYTWEIIVVNDGSSDRTGELADKFAKEHEKVRVFHHFTNRNLGHTLRTGFFHAVGECIIVLDLDLSYSVEHIKRLADTLFNEVADMVIASPYMPGGKSIEVPRVRLLFSKVVNYIMRKSSQEKYYTFTGMVRAYRSSFIKNVNLKTKDYEINPEILYKAMILRARILEIPATLDWSEQNQETKRTSSIKLLKGIFSGLMSSFILRPYIFFMGVGLVTLILSLYVIGWIAFETILIIPNISFEANLFDDKFSYALSEVFKYKPHTFLIGGFSLVVSVLFLGIGFLSLQSKRYYEELFHSITSIRVSIKDK